MYICLVAGISCFFFFLPSRLSSSQTMASLARLFRLLFIYFVLFSLCFSLKRGNNLKSTTFFARAYGLFFALALYVDKYMCILSIALFEWNQFLSTHIFDRLKCFKCVASVFSSSAELNLLDLLIFFTGSFFRSFIRSFCLHFVQSLFETVVQIEAHIKYQFLFIWQSCALCTFLPHPLTCALRGLFASFWYFYFVHTKCWAWACLMLA